MVLQEQECGPRPRSTMPANRASVRRHTVHRIKSTHRIESPENRPVVSRVRSQHSVSSTSEDHTWDDGCATKHPRAANIISKCFTSVGFRQFRPPRDFACCRLECNHPARTIRMSAGSVVVLPVRSGPHPRTLRKSDIFAGLDNPNLVPIFRI